MRQFILIVIFVVIHPNIFSQRYISGKVMEKNGKILPGATICLGNSKDCHTSDINGEFRIFIPDKTDMTMSVYFVGFETVKIENIDTIFHPITIFMEESLFIEYHPNRYYPNRNEFGLSLTGQNDFLTASFDNFELILGKENVENLNKLYGLLNIEFSGWYKGFHFALNYGQTNIIEELDSPNNAKGDYRIFLFGTHFGYNIINSKRFMITPKIGVKWYRYRMINYDCEKRIPMEQYITERDLDIRFNHLIGFAGLNCSYMFYNNPIFSFPLAVGLYGGYAFKLNGNTWVYSTNNRLITNHKVVFGNFNFGIYFSFILT